MAQEPELEEWEVRVEAESALAYLLMDTDTGAQAWFPKSQVSLPKRNLITDMATAEIPVWLLREKGWSD